MKATLGAVMRDAVALWQRDWRVLMPLSGLLFFLPNFALLLLVPQPPPMKGEAVNTPAMMAYAQQLADWMMAHGAAYIARAALGQLGVLAIASWYVASPRLAVGSALTLAVTRLLRLLLAQFLISLPLVASLALFALPGGVLLALVPIFYVMGRIILVTPIIAAEPIGAVAALMRSWAMTRGSGVALALLVGGITIIGELWVAVLVQASELLKRNYPNPVPIAVVDAIAAAAGWAASLALALAAIAIYRRLAPALSSR